MRIVAADDTTDIYMWDDRSSAFHRCKICMWDDRSSAFHRCKICGCGDA
jgi:hypothetical protein